MPLSKRRTLDKLNLSAKRYILVLSAALTAVLYCSDVSHSFLGNIKIGGLSLPCAIACGGDRGIINANFLGDAVNNVFMSSTINSFEGASNRSVDRGIKALDDVLTNQRGALLKDLTALADSERAQIVSELASQRVQLIDQLRDVSSNAISDLDKILRGNIDTASRELTMQRGGIEAALSKQVGYLSGTLLKAVVISIFFVGLSFLAFMIYRTKILNRTQRVGLATSVPIGFSALLGFCAALYVSVGIYENRVAKGVVDDYRQRSVAGIRNVNLVESAYFSNQIYIFTQSDQDWINSETAKLYLDVFSRSSSYRTAAGVRDTLRRISDLETYRIQRHMGSDLNLSLLIGFLTWQGGGDRFSEYMAACSFAAALERAKAAGMNPQPILLPFASYYLQAYLVNPLPDAVIEELFVENGAQKGHVFGPVDPGVSPLNAPMVDRRYTTMELRAISATDVVAIPTTEFYHLAASGAVMLKLYRSVVSNFSEMSRLYALAKGQQKNKVAADRTFEQMVKVAAVIKNDFEAYEEYLKNDVVDSDASKLNTLRGLWDIYEKARAVGYVIGESGPDVPKVNATAFPNELSENRLYERWLDEVVKPVITSVSVYNVVRNSVELDQVEAGAKYFQFEFALQNVRAPNCLGECDSSFREANAHDVARLSAELGLFGCRAPGGPYTPFETPISCDGDGSPGNRTEIVPLAQLLYEGRPATDRVWRDHMVENRMIPAF